MSAYMEAIKSEFTQYGFPNCPLSDSQIETLETRGVCLNTAYGIGCDVNAGIAFQRAMTINMPTIFRGISGNSQWADAAARAGLRRAMVNGKGYSRNEGY